MAEIRKILHVEDDADIREITYLALAEFGGFEVLQCATGMDAIKKAAKFAPDLLLLDVMMPGLSGLETLTKLRRQDELAGVPVIFMTSKDVTSKHHSDIQENAVGAIQKPFDPVALPDQLRAIVANTE